MPGGPPLPARHYRPAIAREVAALTHSGIANGAPINRQVFAERRDGRRFPANLVVSEMQIGGRRAFTGLVRDISQRRRSADEARRLNRKLAEMLALQQAIFDSTEYAMIAVDLQGRVTMFNHGAQRMLGYTEDEMRALGSLSILHEPAQLAERGIALAADMATKVAADVATGSATSPGAASSASDIIVARARHGQRDEPEWTYVRKDGSTLPVMLSATAVTNENQALSGFVCIAQDLSKRKQIEQMKNEFISTLSHELRTPLTSIRGSLGLLAGGAAGVIPATAKTLLDVANKNCERLVRLINDILDVEKIASGTMRFDAVPQPLLPLVEHAVAATHAYAEQFQVSFDLRSDAGDMIVSVDADRLLQVIVNLLSNASKFALAGDVVEVRLRRLKHAARLSVIDHGVGIPPSFRDRIFQKFAQSDATDSRQKGGTGLGLNISRAIIGKHGGIMDFSSEPGVRTEFFFDLPLVAGPA